MRLSALGDIIWTLPMLQLLRKNYPEARITLFVDFVFFSLLEGMEGLRIVPIHKPRSIKDYFKLKKVFSNFYFDILICSHASLRVNLLYPLIDAKRKIGFDAQRGRDFQCLFVNEQIPFNQEHSLEGLLSFARYLNGDFKSKVKIEYGLAISEENILWAQELVGQQKFVAMHPKASSSERTWSEDRYAKIICDLQQRGIQVALTGTNEDEYFIKKIMSLCPQSPVNLAGRTNLKQLASVFKGALLVIAPDSGPIHLACAVGALTLGLYAAVPTGFTGPYGQGPHCVDVYPLAVKKYLHQEADQTPWAKRVRGEGLMDLISIEMVKEKLDALLLEQGHLISKG